MSDIQGSYYKNATGISLHVWSRHISTSLLVRLLVLLFSIFSLCLSFFSSFSFSSFTFVSVFFQQLSKPHKIKEMAVTVTHNAMLSRVLKSGKRMWTILVSLDKKNARKQKGGGKRAPNILISSFGSSDLCAIWRRTAFVFTFLCQSSCTLHVTDQVNEVCALRVWHEPSATTLLRGLWWPARPGTVSDLNHCCAESSLQHS